MSISHLHFLVFELNTGQYKKPYVLKVRAMNHVEEVIITCINDKKQAWVQR
jgi:hypothetical protein